MSFRRACVRTVNSFVSLVIILALLIFGGYSAYALWDNQQVYNAAQNVQLEMKKLKPVIEETEDGPSFEELLAVNPDVKAWVTMDGTQIDYPILQGDTNMSYINTDVYGNFALAGSILLDCRNSGDFSDIYNLVYGHHMDNSNMFGDLDLYRDEDFFRKNTTGTLITRDGVYDLSVLALLIVPASENRVFEVTWNQDPNTVIAFAVENAEYISDNLPQPGDEVQFLALSTCSSDFTDARTIVLTSMNRRTSISGGKEI